MLAWQHLGQGALEPHSLRLGRERCEGAELAALWTPSAADVGPCASPAQRELATRCVSPKP